MRSSARSFSEVREKVLPLGQSLDSPNKGQRLKVQDATGSLDRHPLPATIATVQPGTARDGTYDCPCAGRQPPMKVEPVVRSTHEKITFSVLHFE